MTFVLSGCNGFRNRGVEALITPSVAQLREREPSTDVVVLSGAPEYDIARGSAEATFVRDPYIGRVGSLPMRRLGARWAPRLFRPEAEVRRRIAKASVVIASGGDNFSSDYGDIRMHLEPLRVAQQCGVPTVMLAQSIGPFRKAEHRRHFLEVAQRTNLITVRESRSYHYVVEDLRIDSTKVHLTADPAFLLEATEKRRVARLRDRYELSSDLPTLALAMSRGISSFVGLDSSGEAATRAHLRVLVGLIRTAIDDLGAQVLLVPHVQEVAARNNDMLLAEQLVDAVGDARIRVAWGDHSAADFKGLIAASDLVLAERMHAAIAGISTATPTMVVRYSVKADGIVGDVLGEEGKRCGAIIPFESYLEGRAAIDSLKTAWENRETLRASIASRLDHVRQLSRRNYDMIVDLASR